MGQQKLHAETPSPVWLSGPPICTSEEEVVAAYLPCAPVPGYAFLHPCGPNDVPFEIGF